MMRTFTEEATTTSTLGLVPVEKPQFLFFLSFLCGGGISVFPFEYLGPHSEWVSIYSWRESSVVLEDEWEIGCCCKIEDRVKRFIILNFGE
jgi:hypothetical protein